MGGEGVSQESCLQVWQGPLGEARVPGMLKWSHVWHTQPRVGGSACLLLAGDEERGEGGRLRLGSAGRLV
jgi:hypothetical protein